MRRLIAGCGYLGFRVARLWQAGGDEVHVLTRSQSRARHFQELGFCPWVGDVTRPETLPQLPAIDTMLWSVGFERGSEYAIHDVYVHGLRHLVDTLNHVGRCIYVSSTGVYGQADGDWVNEDTTCQPQRAGGYACLAAEQLLAQSSLANRTVILRLAGIYGPDRLPRLKQLRAGQPLDADPQGLLNLIHVQDAARVILEVADRELRLPRVYLVADGQPVLRAEFYAEAARWFDTPAPVFHAAVACHTTSQRGGGHKRVSNQRLRTELGITLDYPSYREGLAAIRHLTPDT